VVYFEMFSAFVTKAALLGLCDRMIAW